MKDKGIPFPNLGAYILLEASTLGANNLFSTRRLLAPRENMKDKGFQFPNLGATILLEAPTLGAHNLFLNIFNKSLQPPLCGKVILSKNLGQYGFTPLV